MLLYEKQIEQIVEKVVAKLRDTGRLEGSSGDPSMGSTGRDSFVGASPAAASAAAGIHETIAATIAAGKRAAPEVAALSLEKRKQIIEELRRVAVANSELVAKMAVNETGMGRVEDKIAKNHLAATKTPGIEDLPARAQSGDHGLTLTELAPWGLIGSIIPSTNPTETVINNGISMFAAGNSVIFNPHPGAKRTSQRMISLFSETVSRMGGPPDAFASVLDPTIETAQAVMSSPDIRLLVVTGAEGVVRAAMQSGKSVVGAGPGNPPAVVDETADLALAAKNIIGGASLDNNVICTDEKVTVVVESVADRLIKEMVRAGGFLTQAHQTRQLVNLLIPEAQPKRDTMVNRSFVGKDAAVILAEIGIRDIGDPRLVMCDVDADHPMAWTEMLMPVMPIVRARDANAAIDYAVAVEAGRRHTASIHSRNIENLSRMAHNIDCSVFVKNGPNYAGLGLGGEDFTSFTIASPTGHGMTSARTFARLRRCTLVDYFRIV